MPNIRQFENKVEGLHPDERGTDAALQGARRTGAFLNQAGDAVRTVGNETGRMAASALKDAGDVAVDYAQHREISQGGAAYAGLNDRLTQQWNQTAKTADPNDPTVATKFREDVLEPALEKFGQSFLTEGGQKWAEGHTQSLRSHMFEKTAADMGTLAGDAVAVNVRTMSNTMSNTAMTDPSSVPHLLNGIDSTVAAMIESSPNLKGAAAARARLQLTEKMREDIVKSGAIGAIQKARDPEAEAERWGKKYPEFINGSDLKTLSANARQQLRADRMDRAYNDHLVKQQQQDRSDQTEVGYLQKLYSDKPEERASVSTKAIVNDPNLTRQSKERMIGVVERELKPEAAAKTSNVTSAELIDRIRAPEDDPRRITDLEPVYDAYVSGKLTKADFAFVRKEFSDLRTPEGQRLGQAKDQFLKAIGPSIDKSNPLMGKIDQDGKVNNYRLMVDLDAKMDEYRKAGKNPYDLINPSKPDFMGRPEALQPYMKPLNQSITDQARRLAGQPQPTSGGAAAPAPAAPEPRRKGETPADYLKRTGH